MYTIKIIVLFVILCVPIFCWQLPDDLIQVQIVVRHGARTPTDNTYPNDPYINFTYTPYKRGQLTLEGKKNAYKIGRIFRERYQFENVTYNEQILNLTADYSTRVQETAIGLVTALWPPVANETIANGIPWQPVPYTFLELHPFNREEDPACYDNPDFQKVIEPYQSSIDYIMNNSGTTKMNEFYRIYSSLCAQDHYGLELPKWTIAIYPEPLRQINGLFMAAIAFDSSNRKKICKSVRDLANIFRMTIDNNNTPVTSPFNIHTNHDHQIAAMLKCLNVETDEYSPDYVGNMALELYSKPYLGVKLLWHQRLDTEPVYLKMIGCEKILCPFDRWYKLATRY